MSKSTIPRRVTIISVSGRPLEGGQPEEIPLGTRVASEGPEDNWYVGYSKRTGVLYACGEAEVARKVYAERAARIKAVAEGITR